MQKSPAIIFDLGKVLLNFDYSVAVRRLLAQSNQSECGVSEMLSKISQFPLLLDYERGALTTAAFFEKVCAISGYKGTFDAFKEIFGNIFTPIPEMVRLHDDLVARGYPVFIFSNTNELAVAYVRRHFPFFNQFDGYVFSYEHASMKPEPQLYEVLEKLAQRRGRDLIYLDDRPENIAAGLARGWRALVHESPAATRSWIESALAE